MRVVALLVTIGVSMAGCGDDKSPAEEARDDVCEAQGDLRDELTHVADDIRAGNLGDAGDELSDVTESIDELSTAAGNLAEAELAEVQPQVDAITTALGGITVSDLGSLGTTLDTIRDEVDQALDAIGNTNALDCS